MSFTLKKFESQGEIDEKKKKRQEEWDKVRKPEDPVECPEVPVDNRCLFDKLEEQRLKKQEEYEEKIALKNQVKGLDDDESEFLDFVTDRQLEITKERRQEEQEVLSEMKDAQVRKITDTKVEEKKSKPSQQSSTRRSQMALLAGAVKRKSTDDTAAQKKAKQEVSSTEPEKQKGTPDPLASTSSTSTMPVTQSSTVPIAKVIAIRPSALPFISQYEDSSDSMSSSSDSEPDFSLSARNSVSNLIKQHVAQQQHQS